MSRLACRTRAGQDVLNRTDPLAGVQRVTYFRFFDECIDAEPRADMFQQRIPKDLAGRYDLPRAVSGEASDDIEAAHPG